MIKVMPTEREYHKCSSCETTDNVIKMEVSNDGVHTETIRLCGGCLGSAYVQSLQVIPKQNNDTDLGMFAFSLKHLGKMQLLDALKDINYRAGDGLLSGSHDYVAKQMSKAELVREEYDRRGAAE